MNILSALRFRLHRSATQFYLFIIFFLVHIITGQAQVRLGRDRYNLVCGAKPSFAVSPLTNVSTKQAIELLNYLNNSGIQFNYPQGNCQDRAHMMCLLLAKKGINTGKIWAFAPGAYSLADASLLSVADKNGMVANGERIKWGFHVAPLLLVQSTLSSGQTIVIDTVVLDPSINSQKPLPYKEWISALGTHNIGFEFTDRDWYRFNSLAGLKAYNNSNTDLMNCGGTQNVILPSWFPDIFTGSFYKYEGDAKSEDRMAQGLALNDIAYLFIQKEAKPLIGQPNEAVRLRDYQLLVGNMNNFESVFRYNKSTNDISPEFLTKYASIITPYRQQYLLAVAKWKATTTSLL